MMVGDLQYVDTFVTPSSEENPLSGMAYIFCFLFLFIMSLALMNILVSLRSTKLSGLEPLFDKNIFTIPWGA